MLYSQTYHQETASDLQHKMFVRQSQASKQVTFMVTVRTSLPFRKAWSVEKGTETRIDEKTSSLADELNAYM